MVLRSPPLGLQLFCIICDAARIFLSPSASYHSHSLSLSLWSLLSSLDI